MRAAGTGSPRPATRTRPCATARTAEPTGPLRCHQVPAATRTARPMSRRPNPSRRWAGSIAAALCRAPRPIRRAVRPIACARASQMPRTRRPHARATVGADRVRRACACRRARPAGPVAATRSAAGRRCPTATTRPCAGAHVCRLGKSPWAQATHGPHRSQVSHAAPLTATSAGTPVSLLIAVTVQTQGVENRPVRAQRGRSTTGAGASPPGLRTACGACATTTRPDPLRRPDPVRGSYLTLLLRLADRP